VFGKLVGHIRKVNWLGTSEILENKLSHTISGLNPTIIYTIRVELIDKADNMATYTCKTYNFSTLTQH